jgi:ABC-type multidrug transport system ATPase subunit
MQVTADKLCKRYFYQWIIKDLNFVFQSGESYAIEGRNGSGKSTLIKMLSGYLSPSSGQLKYTLNGADVNASQVYKCLTLAAPYTDLIQEFSLNEVFDFHIRFKPLYKTMSFNEFESLIELKNQGDKQIRFFSSGMKQKVQLALAVLSKSELLLLDEPTSYLDENAKEWFRSLMSQFHIKRTVIIASNDRFDKDLCRNILSL